LQGGVRPSFADVTRVGGPEGGRGRARQGHGGATAAVMDPREGRGGPGPSGLRRGGNQEDLAERGQAGHGQVRFKK
jgi:hypothetical protein